MGDMHARRAAFLAAKNRKHASALREYIRPGRPSIEILLTRGSTTFELDRGGAGSETVVTDDWICSPEDLLIEAEPVVPEMGDLVRETIGGKRVTYEALSVDRQPCWRWVDSQRQRIRIHTKQIKSEPV